MTLHPDTLPFLSELRLNNNRPWFNEHKDRWLAIKAQFELFTQGLIEAMESVDPTLRGLTAKNSIYRIYRDTRFTPDKTPYKTHISCFLSSWGPKNSGVPGYFFQLGVDEAYGLKGICNLGGGIFMPTPEALNAIRQEIVYCTDEFLDIINEPKYKKYYGSGFFTTHKLSRVPKGFPADFEQADLLKYKDYCCSHTLADAYVVPQSESIAGKATKRGKQDGCPEELFDRVVEIWRAAVPLNRFVQRAMEEVRQR